MNGSAFAETKNMRGVDGEIIFSDGTTEILEYDTDDTVIKFHAYGGNKKIVSVKLPVNIKTIEFAAFAECTSLESIIIPRGLETIEDSAFLSCAGISSIVVQDGNKCYKSIDGVLFTIDEKRLVCYPPKKSEAEYTVPYGVTDIASSAFYGCKSLVTVNIPESVTFIGGSAFEGCTNLKNIAVPEGVTTVGGGAFKDCVNLESITIPRGVATIGGSTFENCTNLCSITLPKSVTAIKDRAFFGCKRLGSITVYEAAEQGTLPAPIDEFREGILKNSEYREGFLVSTTSIGWNAFDGCESLKAITLPEGVYSIGSHAFKGCKNLESIIVPKSVNYIGRGIFEGCTSLKRIYYKGSSFGWKRIEKAMPYPELIRLGEDQYISAMIYYHYSDSKFYKVMRVFPDLWKDYLDNDKGSLLHKILVAILVASGALIVVSLIF